MPAKQKLPKELSTQTAKTYGGNDNSSSGLIFHQIRNKTDSIFFVMNINPGLYYFISLPEEQ
jgi:hypothetical protein